MPLLSPAPREPALSSLRAEFAGCRVLLVEDSDIFAELLGVLLEESGVHVDRAEHGAQALERVAGEAYAAVLMDVEMPVMGGLEATRRLRQLPGLGPLPIIALSASTREEDRRRCFAAGMDAFVTKPADPDDLYGTLLELLRARRGRSSPASPRLAG